MNTDNNNHDIGITVSDNDDHYTKTNVQFSPIKQLYYIDSNLNSNSNDDENEYVYATPSRDSNDNSNSKPKALPEREWLEFMMILVGSIVLSFNAGYVNGCTYQSMMGKGKPVSHVSNHCRLHHHHHHHHHHHVRLLVLLLKPACLQLIITTMTC